MLLRLNHIACAPCIAPVLTHGYTPSLSLKSKSHQRPTRPAMEENVLLPLHGNDNVATRPTENIKLHVHVTTYTLSQSLISLHPTADLPHQLPIYLLPTYDSFTYPRFISPSHMKK